MNDYKITSSIISKSKIIILIVVCFLFSNPTHSQIIQVTNVSPNPVCAGQSLTVTFKATNGNGNQKYFTSSTVFRAYLSSVGGTAPYTLLGDLSLNPHGFISGNGAVNSGVQGIVTLPSNASGIYKIAVGSVQPSFDASNGAGASLNFTVNAAPLGGIVSGDTTVCPGSNSTLLTLSGHSGIISKWQSSTVSDFSSNVIDIANTTTTYTATNIGVTTYFRAVIGNGTCQGNSGPATVQVASGNPSVNQSICFNTQPTDIQLASYQGTSIQWQSSNDNLNFFNIPGATASTLQGSVIGNLVETMYYRAVVSGGTCGTMISGTVTVIVSTASVGGSISPSTVSPAICPSDTVVLTLSGHTGSVVKWQSSTQQNFNNNVVDIFNYTTTLSVTNLTTTTYFRAVVANGGCTGATSTKATVNVVNGGPVGGTISPNTTTHCSAVNSTVLTLSGQNGTVVRWESSPVSDFSSGVISINNTTGTLAATNVSTTMYYRAVIAKSTCIAYSSVALITIYPSLTASISGNNSGICSGSDAVFILTGSSGAIVNYSINGGATQAVLLSGGSATVTIVGVTSNQIMSLISVNSGTCSQSLTGSSTVIVNPSATASIVGNNSPVCVGANAIFNLSGSNNAVVTYTINGGGAQTVTLSGLGAATVTLTAVSSNQTLNLISASLGSCTTFLSGNATVTVNASNVWTGAASDNQWSTSGNWSCNILPTADSNVVINSGSVIVSGINALANTIALNGTSTLTVNPGNNITVSNAVNVAVGAAMVLQNNANLIQVNNAVNLGSITVNRESSALKRLDYTLWSSPVAAQNLLTFSPQTITTRFYTYNSLTNAYASIVPSSNSFQLAKGYLIRMPDNHPTTPTKWNGVFNGVPNNGNLTFTASNGGAGFRFNAVGNPYPSPISMVDFVNANTSNITGTLYFWRKTNSTATDPGYCTWTPGGGFTSNGESEVFDPNGIIRTGQGFIVEMQGNATTVNFSNVMRRADNANQFFKTTAKSDSINGDRIWLNLIKSGGGFSQMLLGYFANATLGVDYGIDGSVLGNPRPLLCSTIDNVDYAIQGRPSFVNTDIVPLNFRTATAGSFTIVIDHVDGLFLGNQGILLRDNTTHAVHDLKSGGYSFTSPAGDFPLRFEIGYQGNTLNVTQTEFNSETLVVYKENQDIVVNTNGVLLDKVEIYDINGRKLIEREGVNDSKLTIRNLNLANQILLIKALSHEGVIVTKKIAF